jgi:hypothetical protein
MLSRPRLRPDRTEPRPLKGGSLRSRRLVVDVLGERVHLAAHEPLVGIPRKTHPLWRIWPCGLAAAIDDGAYANIDVVHASLQGIAA